MQGQGDSEVLRLGKEEIKKPTVEREICMLRVRVALGLVILSLLIAAISGRSG